MKIKRTDKMTFDQADQLIEKYYEGITSVEEEKELHAFLKNPDLPEKYHPEQAIFGYFKSGQEKPRFNLNVYLRWSGVAAVLLSGVFAIQLFLNTGEMSYAYIDGEKTTNLHEIKLHAMASLGNLPSGQSIVKENLQQVSSKDLIQEQLNVFSAFE